MEIAKTTDLPDLLEHLGYHVKRVGSRYHSTSSSQAPYPSPRRKVQRRGSLIPLLLLSPQSQRAALQGPHWDSLIIKDRRTWKRYSNGKGGDAITFLQEFCGKGFREAVDYLLEFNGGRTRDFPSLREPRAPPQLEERPSPRTRTALEVPILWKIKSKLEEITMKRILIVTCALALLLAGCAPALAAEASESQAPDKSCYYPIAVESYTSGPLDELRISKTYQELLCKGWSHHLIHMTAVHLWQNGTLQL